ncbi:hypothetical protein [Nocardia sp. NPDC004711]
MTSPNFPADPAPAKTYTASTVASLQHADREQLAIEDNQGTYDLAEAVRGQFFSVIYQQVQQIPIVGGLIGDIIEIITGVEDGDLNDLGTWIHNLGNFVNNFIAAALHALADLCEWIPFVGDDLASIIDGIADGMNTVHATATTTVQGITGGSSDPSQVASTVGSIQDSLAANSAAIAELQNNQTGGSTGGASYTVTFPDTILGNLGPGWTLGGMPTALWATGGGVAGLQPDNGYANGTRWALHNTVMQTDDHHVIMVAGNAGTTQSMTSLIVRAAADMSKFVYLNVYNARAYLGWATWNGTAYAYHDWADTDDFTVAAGKTFTLKAEGNTYTATLNGVTLLAHTDASGQAAVGAAYRSVGMMSSQWTDIFGTPYTGWNVKSFSAADVSSPAVTGTGWSIYQSTSSVALPSGGGWTTVGAGTFDVVRDGQLVNCDIIDFGRGVVQIRKPGWYHVAGSVQVSVYQVALQLGIYFKPAGSSSKSVARSFHYVDGGGSGDNTGTFNASTSNVMYLRAGDQVSPAVFSNQGGNLTGNGPAGTGYRTYFEGALLNG